VVGFPIWTLTGHGFHMASAHSYAFCLLAQCCALYRVLWLIPGFHQSPAAPTLATHCLFPRTSSTHSGISVVFITNDPADISAEDLLDQPLWMGPTSSQTTMFPTKNAAMVLLTTREPPNAPGMWTALSMLLLSVSGNLSIRFAMAIDNTFS